MTIPLMFVIAGDSLLASYAGIRDAFERGMVVSGVAGLLQILLLAIAVAGVALTFALVGRRLGAIAWRWSEGKPILRAGLSSARFGLAIVAVATIGVALFTWLPSGDRATTDGGTLAEALERAGNQVATLLGADGDTASAEEADSEEPGQLLGILAGAVLPDREEKGSDDTSTREPPNDKANTSDKTKTSDKASNETPRPNQRTNETPEPSSVTLAPRESVPTVTEVPPVVPEAPASTPTAPIEEPVAQEPVAEEPPVAYEPPPPVAEEPPVAYEPPLPTEPPPSTEPSGTPPTPPPGPPPEEVTPDAPPGTPKAPPVNCTTSPGDEPGTTTTHCTI